MLTPGDVVELDLGIPSGSEAVPRRPAIVVAARRVLWGDASIVHVVPLTQTVRDSSTEVVDDPDEGKSDTVRARRWRFRTPHRV
jgi:mRNA interferase MazF